MSTPEDVAEVVDEASKVLAKNPASRWLILIMSLLLAVAVYGTRQLDSFDKRMTVSDLKALHAQENTARSIDHLAEAVKDGLANGKNEREQTDDRVAALEAEIKAHDARLKKIEGP